MADKNKPILLDDKMKEALRKAGALGFSVENTFLYVPRAFRDPVNQIPKNHWPVYTLRAKSGIEIADVEDKAGYYEDGKLHLESGSTRLETLRIGIISVKRFIMEDGSIIDFKEGENIDSLIAKFPIALQVELQNAINERKTLTKEELAGLES